MSQHTQNICYQPVNGVEASPETENTVKRFGKRKINLFFKRVRKQVKSCWSRCLPFKKAKTRQVVKPPGTALPEGSPHFTPPSSEEDAYQNPGILRPPKTRRKSIASPRTRGTEHPVHTAFHHTALSDIEESPVKPLRRTKKPDSPRSLENVKEPERVVTTPQPVKPFKLTTDPSSDGRRKSLVLERKRGYESLHWNQKQHGVLEAADRRWTGMNDGMNVTLRRSEDSYTRDDSALDDVITLTAEQGSRPETNERFRVSNTGNGFEKEQTGIVGPRRVAATADKEGAPGRQRSKSMDDVTGRQKRNILPDY